MTEAEYEREIARLKMVIRDAEQVPLGDECNMGMGKCPWCDALISLGPIASRDSEYQHFERCPAFTPEGVVK